LFLSPLLLYSPPQAAIKDEKAREAEAKKTFGENRK